MISKPKSHKLPQFCKKVIYFLWRRIPLTDAARPGNPVADVSSHTNPTPGEYNGC